MASPGDDKFELLNFQCGNENDETESRSRQGSSDSSFQDDRTEMPFQEQGSNLSTTPQSAETGNSPSNADGEGGQAVQKFFKKNRKRIRCVLFLLHAVKLGLVLCETYLLGTDQTTFSRIIQGGDLTLKHLLLENWDARWETTKWQQSHGDFAVYSIDDVESGINYAVTRYFNAEEHAAGLYKRMDNTGIEAVIKYFDLPDSEVVSRGITITGWEIHLYKATTLTYFLGQNCNVTFKDTDFNGQVRVDLETYTSKLNCRDMGLSVEELRLLNISIGLKILVLIACGTSLVLVLADVILHNRIFDVLRPARKEPNIQSLNGCYARLKASLKSNETSWDLFVCVWDAFTVYVTCRLLSMSNVVDLSVLGDCALKLGYVCILECLTSVRYFQVVDNNKVYLPFKVFKRAIFGVLCYTLCLSVIFVGFWFGGFAILGPYDSKFSTIGSAFMALFSLPGLDELRATYYMFDDKKLGSVPVLRIYLAVYMFLFICVVTNMLFVLFTSANEVIKEQHEDPKHPASVNLRRCLCDAEDLRKKLEEFIKENDEQEHTP